MTVWKDISTAPKDGSGLLLIDVDSEDPQAGIGFWRDGIWSAIDPRDDKTGELAKVIVWIEPTHWTELPPPPDNTDV